VRAWWRPSLAYVLALGGLALAGHLTSEIGPTLGCMTEPDYRERNAMADTKLDDAKKHLESALEADLDTRRSRTSKTRFGM
jgi:hypothetical protein